MRSEPLVGDSQSRTLGEALRSPAFWVFGLGSSLYGLIAAGIALFNQSILLERRFWLSTHADLHDTARMRAVRRWLRDLTARSQDRLSPHAPRA